MSCLLHCSLWREEEEEEEEEEGMEGWRGGQEKRSITRRRSAAVVLILLSASQSQRCPHTTRYQSACPRTRNGRMTMRAQLSRESELVYHLCENYAGKHVNIWLPLTDWSHQSLDTGWRMETSTFGPVASIKGRRWCKMCFVCADVAFTSLSLHKASWCRTIVPNAREMYFIRAAQCS